MEGFRQILKMTQPELHFYLLGRLEHYYKLEDIFIEDGSFIYVRGEIPVLLLAHLDTVHLHAPTDDSIFYDQEQGVIWSPDGIGGDDRCGVFSILEMLEKGYRPHVLFCWDEEVGTIGSSNFTTFDIEDTEEINFAIQLDRKGFGESVYYNLDNKDFEDYINSFGFETELGSYTDICQVCPSLGFAGVNLSAGYMDEHMDIERIYFFELKETQRKVMEILDDQKINPRLYDYKDKSSYSYRYSSYYDPFDYYNNSLSNSYNGYPGEDEDDDYNEDGEYIKNFLGSSEKTIEEDTECQFCGAIKGTVPWDETDSPVLSCLCNECREEYGKDVSNHNQYKKEQENKE